MPSPGAIGLRSVVGSFPVACESCSNSSSRLALLPCCGGLREMACGGESLPAESIHHMASSGVMEDGTLAIQSPGYRFQGKLLQETVQPVGKLDGPDVVQVILVDERFVRIIVLAIQMGIVEVEERTACFQGSQASGQFLPCVPGRTVDAHVRSRPIVSSLWKIHKDDLDPEGVQGIDDGDQIDPVVQKWLGGEIFGDGGWDVRGWRIGD